MSGAILIDLTPENASDSVLIHQFEHSKQYRHDLEVIGGKGNVLADEFCRWFEGLWHGRSLALIVACISILIACGLSFVAYHLPFDPKPDAGDENDRTGATGTAK